MLKKGPLETDLEESIFHAYVNSSAIWAHPGYEDTRIVYWFKG